MECEHKTLLRVKVLVSVVSIVKPIWEIEISLPSSIIVLLIPPYFEWMERFCRLDMMWWEAPKPITRFPTLLEDALAIKLACGS